MGRLAEGTEVGIGDRIHDGEVIAASRSRPEAFEAIFERHYAAVVRFAVGRVGYEAAADVAAETFVRAFERRRRFQVERPSALPWLFGIASNVSRERLRSRSRQDRAQHREASMVSRRGDFEVEAVDRLDAERAGPRLESAMRALSAEEYRILMLSAHTDLTYAEIAGLLRIPIGTVRSRLSRARARLRELVGGLESIQTGLAEPSDGRPLRSSNPR